MYAYIGGPWQAAKIVVAPCVPTVVTVYLNEIAKSVGFLCRCQRISGWKCRGSGSPSCILIAPGLTHIPILPRKKKENQAVIAFVATKHQFIGYLNWQGYQNIYELPEHEWCPPRLLIRGLKARDRSFLLGPSWFWNSNDVVFITILDASALIRYRPL